MRSQRMDGTHLQGHSVVWQQLLQLAQHHQAVGALVEVALYVGELLVELLRRYEQAAATVQCS